MIVLHPPGETHSHHFGDSDSRVLCIEITPSGMNHLHINGIRSLPRRAIVGGSVAQLGHRVVHQMKLNDAAANVAIEGLVLEIVSQLLRTGDSGKSSLKWMSTVMNYLHTNFAAAISLGRIAGIAGIHPVHLARSFRSSQGCTIGEYIRRLRIEEACKRLEMSDLPVTELAQECGFFDHSHFCRVFKRHVGVSPSEFRRAFKE